MAGQKQKRRLKKGFNYAGGCRHTFCGNATGLYGSLSAVFKVLEAASAASKQARCLLSIKENISFPTIRDFISEAGLPVSMIACLTLVTHMRNLIGIREFLRLYKLIERELIERYSFDAKVLDDIVAEDCIYRVFNSKTLFGTSGRKYFYKWEMARLDDGIILMIKENEAKKNKIN
ncbi:hypothetical protein MF621_004193 (plasmid) [Bacillus velezensis]|uniref:hypothetical protein n=1 Tax=Bacillus velezensis TaxID=492670 RepID=UPI002024C721|nr:hypothetical protein [Bacillus velezensis]URJ76495.1 hypothetical protein MF619_004212 [Bacillus velezensis]URJ80502.1 hypothetical protein MF621_004193 [Bacillus velezensis]